MYPVHWTASPDKVQARVVPLPILYDGCQILRCDALTRRKKPVVPLQPLSHRMPVLLQCALRNTAYTILSACQDGQGRVCI